MIFDHFDRIRIVNLPHRKDRRREMRAQLAAVGLRDDPRIEFFPAFSFDHPGLFRSKGSHGNFESQRFILEEASRARQSVLILEDDCNFRVAEILRYEPPPFDVFYGGYTARDPEDLEQSDIIGSHFMGFSARGAEVAASYLASYITGDFVPSPAVRSVFHPSSRPGIDGAYVWLRRTYPDLVTVFSDLGYQRPSRTDVGKQKWFDRLPVVRSAAAMARRIKRASGGGMVFGD